MAARSGRRVSRGQFVGLDLCEDGRSGRYGDPLRAQAAAHPAGIASPRTPFAFPPARTLMFDYLIVGAGFAGCTLAERLAEGAGKRVLLIDKRRHVGGNA